MLRPRLKDRLSMEFILISPSFLLTFALDLQERRSMNEITNKVPLVGLSIEEIEALIAPLREPKYRGEQIYKWVHHFQVSTFEEMTNLPRALRERLAERYTLRTLSMESRSISQDGTRKYLWRLPDGKFIESVFIPEATRTTVCISSQVGCALGCQFCATAQMGFLRNLTAGEIVEQVIAMQQDTRQKITNVVFMGMGEPFLNYPRVIAACKILSDPRGLAISAKKITISTVGIVPKILQFTDEKQPYSLAISLHAPTQEIREKIMPIAQ
ncbi:MAG: 23S rRNA (adenine(2503)-C(2))-methyltransferase RlmN, partial [Methanobacteriota archaeon]